MSGFFKKMSPPKRGKNKDYKKIIMNTFWNGNYFYDDLKREYYVTADAQFAPFYCGIINDNQTFDKVLETIKNYQKHTK